MGCSVIGVERGDDVHAQFNDGFVVQANDSIYVSGTQDAVGRYFEVFGAK